ncbi:MAG: hypothetical protein U5N86_03985 [Planctomycetota bacterium]|nr:hypothetical protein [Planctomycetota bacterium]
MRSFSDSGREQRSESDSSSRKGEQPSSQEFQEPSVWTVREFVFEGAGVLKADSVTVGISSIAFEGAAVASDLTGVATLTVRSDLAELITVSAESGEMESGVKLEARGVNLAAASELIGKLGFADVAASSGIADLEATLAPIGDEFGGSFEAIRE